MADLLVSASGPLSSLHVEVAIDDAKLLVVDTDPLFSLLGGILESVTGGGVDDVPALGGLLSGLLGAPATGPDFGNSEPAPTAGSVLFLDDVTTIALPNL